MPGWSSSGNSTPQSTMSSLPSKSKTVMLRPISPRPPSGTIRRAPSGRGEGAFSSGCGWLIEHSCGEALDATVGQVERQPGELVLGEVDQRWTNRSPDHTKLRQCCLHGHDPLGSEDSGVHGYEAEVQSGRKDHIAGFKRGEHVADP